MAKIIAPNKQYTGISASVSFVNGVGETSDPYLLDWFRTHGYEIEEIENTDADLEALRERGKELGIRSAHNMGKDKLTAAIAEKETEEAAEKELSRLRTIASALGIENLEGMDAEKLKAEIVAKGGAVDGSNSG